MGRMIQILKVSVLMTLLAVLLSGCARGGEENVLWVVTEKTAWDGMNSQAMQLAEIFESEHPGLTVKLDILPQDQTARGMYLKQLRTEIMGGRGPDVFLLPTENNLSKPIESHYWDVYETERVFTREWEPLFSDVERAMGNGLFADLSPYYDADDSLGKDALNTRIMDAGTYRDGRYLLPLRYDFPVLYVNETLLRQFGLTLEEVDGNILQLLDLAISSGQFELAAGAEPYLLRLGRGFSFLSPVTDGGNRVLLTEGEVAALLTRFQQVEALVGEQFEHRRPLNFMNLYEPYAHVYDPAITVAHVIIGFRYQPMFPDALPLHVGTLPESVWIRPYAQMDKGRHAMLPLRSAGDTLNAYGTYFGAVGGGCRTPREAYDFLRLFLLEPAQFEQGRPFKTVWDLHGKPYHAYLMEAGWPVRTGGSANAVWRNVRDYVSMFTPFYNAWSAEGWPIKYSGSGVYRLRFTDEDIPLLEAEFDHVYFGNVLEQDLGRMLRSLNDQRTGQPTEADVDAMAKEFIKKLQWQVMEG